MKKTVLFFVLLSIFYFAGFSQQNVGIGTNNPGSKLQISGSLAAGWANQTTTPYSLGTNDYYDAWSGSVNGTFNLPAGISGSGNFVGRIYILKNATGTYTLTIQANGSEKIDGATSLTVQPGNSVTLISNGSTGAVTTWNVVSSTPSSGSATGWSTAGNAGTTPSSSPIGTAVNNNFAGTTDNKDFVIATNNLERIRIANGGNLGVGTTTPQQPLDVNGVINSASGYRYNNSNQGSGTYLRSSGTNFVPSAIQATDVPTLNQNTTGSAGSVTSGVTFNNGGSGAASGSSFNGSSAITVSYNTVGAAPASGSGNYIQNQTSLQSSSNFNISGIGAAQTGVAIGTSSVPQGKLWVQDGDIWITGNNQKLAFTTDESTDATPNASITASQNGISGNSADLVFNTWNGSANAEIMRVRSNGDLGVGTASPNNTLEVNGGARVDNLALGGAGNRVVYATANGDLTTDANTIAKTDPIYIRGSGLNNATPAIVIIGGTTVVNTTSRGLTLVIVNKATHAVVSVNTYDTYGSTAASSSLATALNAITNSQIGILVDYDSFEGAITSSLQAAFQRLGLYKALMTTVGSDRRAYAAIFEASSSSSVPSASANEVEHSNDATQPYAEMRGWLIDGGFVATADQRSGFSTPIGAFAAAVNESGYLGIGTASPAQQLDVYGNMAMNGRMALSDAGDGWLRLNQNGNYSNGTYTPGFLRVDGGFASGGVGSLGAGTVYATGAVRLSNYTNGFLQVDGSGNLFVSNGSDGTLAQGGPYNVYTSGSSLLSSNYVIYNGQNNSGFYQQNEAPYNLNYVSGDNSMPFGYAINDARTGEHSGFVMVPQASNGANGNMIFYVGNDGSNQFQFAPFTWDGANNHIGTPVMSIGAYSGLVGIGTTSPLGNLDIEATAANTYGHLVVNRNNSAGVGGELSINNFAGGAGAQAVLGFGTDPSSNFDGSGNNQNNAEIRAINDNGTNNATDLRFSNWSGSAENVNMVISSAGRVGIGTISPSNVLHVGAEDGQGIDIGNPNDPLNDANGGTYSIRFYGYRDVINYGISAKITAQRTYACCSGAGSLPWLEQGTDLVFSTTPGMAVGSGSSGSPADNSYERFRVTGSGNVGVGTSAPAYLLDVNGTFHTSASVSDASYTTLNALIEQTNSGVNPGIGLRYTPGGSAGAILFGNGGSNGLNVGTIPTPGNYGPVYASGFTVTSDVTMKKDIQYLGAGEFDACLEQIRKVQSIRFRYNSESESHDEKMQYRPQLHIGVAAQSLPEEVVDHVQEMPSGASGVMKLGMSLPDMSGLLMAGVKALDNHQQNTDELIKVQQQTIDQQQQKLDTQQQQIDALKAAIDELKGKK